MDARGDTIPSNPANLPYKLIEGYPEYIVGPGDFLEITTYQTGDRFTETVRVIPTGTISFSVVRSLPVAGLSVSEVTETATDALAHYVRNPQLQVLVKDYLSKSASVFGSINIVSASLSGRRMGPGVYPLHGLVSALDLILEAGGPASDARLDQVRLIRSNRTYILDLQRAVSAGDNSQNIVMEHGDVLQLPGIAQADRRVAVLGEVFEPGVFNLSSEANMLEAIAASNGFTEDAAANRVRIIRTADPINPTIITVNAERIMRGDLSQNVGLIDGDILVVSRDVLTDIGDLIAQISPLIGFGGIARADPILNVGGWSVNRGGAGTTTPTTEEAVAAASAAAAAKPVPSEVIQQVQNSLKGQSSDTR